MSTCRKNPPRADWKLTSGRLALALALSSALACTQAGAEAPASVTGVQDGLALQAARAVRKGDRGAKKWYSKKFDLSGLPSYRPQQQVSGKLRIWGNNYVADGRLADLWKEGFHKFQPGIEIEYVLPTSLVAVPALYTGVADLGLTRKITFYEQLGFERLMGFAPEEYLALTGAYDVPGWSNAVAIAVNDANPLKSLTMEQLDGIFGAARDGGWDGTSWHPEWKRGKEKNIRTWGQLGLKGEWADKPITVYGYSMRYNLTYQFSDMVLQAGDKWNEDIHLFANATTPSGVGYSQADQMQDAIKADRYAIGFLGYRGEKPGIKHLAVTPVGGKAPITVTLDSVQDRSYPLLTDVYWYVAHKPGTPMDPKVREFLRYAMSREGQQAIQEDAKFLPLTAEAAKPGLDRLH